MFSWPVISSLSTLTAILLLTSPARALPQAKSYSGHCTTNSGPVEIRLDFAQNPSAPGLEKFYGELTFDDGEIIVVMRAEDKESDAARDLLDEELPVFFISGENSSDIVKGHAFGEYQSQMTFSSGKPELPDYAAVLLEKLNVSDEFDCAYQDLENAPIAHVEESL